MKNEKMQIYLLMAIGFLLTMPIVQSAQKSDLARVQGDELGFDDEEGDGEGDGGSEYGGEEQEDEGEEYAAPRYKGPTRSATQPLQSKTDKVKHGSWDEALEEYYTLKQKAAKNPAYKVELDRLVAGMKGTGKIKKYARGAHGSDQQTFDPVAIEREINAIEIDGRPMTIPEFIDSYKNPEDVAASWNTAHFEHKYNRVTRGFEKAKRIIGRMDSDYAEELQRVENDVQAAHDGPGEDEEEHDGDTSEPASGRGSLSRQSSVDDELLQDEDEEEEGFSAEQRRALTQGSWSQAMKIYIALGVENKKELFSLAKGIIKGEIKGESERTVNPKFDPQQFTKILKQLEIEEKEWQSVVEIYSTPGAFADVIETKTEKPAGLANLVLSFNALVPFLTTVVSEQDLRQYKVAENRALDLLVPVQGIVEWLRERGLERQAEYIEEKKRQAAAKKQPAVTTTTTVTGPSSKGSSSAAAALPPAAGAPTLVRQSSVGGQPAAAPAKSTTTAVLPAAAAPETTSRALVPYVPPAKSTTTGALPAAPSGKASGAPTQLPAGPAVPAAAAAAAADDDQDDEDDQDKGLLVNGTWFEALEEYLKVALPGKHHDAQRAADMIQNKRPKAKRFDPQEYVDLARAAKISDQDMQDSLAMFETVQDFKDIVKGDVGVVVTALAHYKALQPFLKKVVNVTEYDNVYYQALESLVKGKDAEATLRAHNLIEEADYVRDENKGKTVALPSPAKPAKPAAPAPADEHGLPGDPEMSIQRKKKISIETDKLERLKTGSWADALNIYAQADESLKRAMKAIIEGKHKGHKRAESFDLDKVLAAIAKVPVTPGTEAMNLTRFIEVYGNADTIETNIAGFLAPKPSTEELIAKLKEMDAAIVIIKIVAPTTVGNYETARAAIVKALPIEEATVTALNKAVLKDDVKAMRKKLADLKVQQAGLPEAQAKVFKTGSVQEALLAYADIETPGWLTTLGITTDLKPLLEEIRQGLLGTGGRYNRTVDPKIDIEAIQAGIKGIRADMTLQQFVDQVYNVDAIERNMNVALGIGQDDQGNDRAFNPANVTQQLTVLEKMNDIMRTIDKSLVKKLAKIYIEGQAILNFKTRLAEAKRSLTTDRWSQVLEHVKVLETELKTLKGSVGETKDQDLNELLERLDRELANYKTSVSKRTVDDARAVYPFDVKAATDDITKFVTSKGDPAGDEVAKFIGMYGEPEAFVDSVKELLRSGKVTDTGTLSLALNGIWKGVDVLRMMSPVDADALTRALEKEKIYRLFIAKTIQALVNKDKRETFVYAKWANALKVYSMLEVIKVINPKLTASIDEAIAGFKGEGNYARKANATFNVQLFDAPAVAKKIERLYSTLIDPIQEFIDEFNAEPEIVVENLVAFPEARYGNLEVANIKEYLQARIAILKMVSRADADALEEYATEANIEKAIKARKRALELNLPEKQAALLRTGSVREALITYNNIANRTAVGKAGEALASLMPTVLGGGDSYSYLLPEIRIGLMGRGGRYNRTVQPTFDIATLESNLKSKRSSLTEVLSPATEDDEEGTFSKEVAARLKEAADIIQPIDSSIAMGLRKQSLNVKT